MVFSNSRLNYVNLKFHTNLLGILPNTSLLGGLSQLMAYFANALRQQLESLQSEPIQISEKLELVTKIMFGYHGNNKSADFY